MNENKAYVKKTSTKKVVEQIKNNTPWIYASDIDKIEGNITKGCIIKVFTIDNIYLCTGYINLQSKILIRVLSTTDEIIDDNFWYQRLYNAYLLRKDLNKLSVARVVFSEADFIPGLVVDKYGDYLVIQSTTAGIDNVLDIICKHLKSIYKPLGIYLRMDVNIREKEGIEVYKKFYENEFNTLIRINENDCIMEVDIENGQKTGYFLDQQENRKIVGEFSKNKEVIDLFSHTGGFALNALKNGAKHVTAVDISSLATNQIMKNAKLNNFENIDVVCADIMDYLPKLVSENKVFDIVVLDPPAFTKTKDTVKTAYIGYRKINQLALKIVKKGGYLFTFSCSRYMTRDLFIEMLKEASSIANCKIQIIEERMQAKDHPMLLGSDNSYYLKCFILRVL